MRRTIRFILSLTASCLAIGYCCSSSRAESLDAPTSESQILAPIMTADSYNTQASCNTCPPAGASDNANSYPTVRVTGFFQADAGWIQQPADNRAVVGDIQDGADFRRARLAAIGDVAENVGYLVEFDLSLIHI